MAENKEKPIEDYIFRDIYKFFMKYSQHKLKASEWVSLSDEMLLLNKKYNDVFASRMLGITYSRIVRCQEHFGSGSAWLEDLERRKEENSEAV